jgi:hypothetical protein
LARHLRADQPYGSAMAPIDPSGAREFLEAIIAAFSLLGGGMAYFSGHFAARALAQHQPPEVVAQRINEGIGEGFVYGSLPAIVALMIMVWS